MGPVIILILGMLFGAFFHRCVRPFWFASSLAGVCGTIMWCVSMYALLFLTAPNELGWPLLTPALLTLATALLGGIAAGAMLRVSGIAKRS
jgi:hypothetical protein